MDTEDDSPVVDLSVKKPSSDRQVKMDVIDLPQDLSVQRSSYAGASNAISAHSNVAGVGFSGNGVNRSALSPIQAHMQSPYVASQHRLSKNSWPKDEIQVTRIEKPKERDATKDVERPVKDEIEVLQLRDSSRSSLNKANLRPFVLRAENKLRNDHQNRLNGYSNGYGSASDMEITDEIVDEDDASDDGVNPEDLPLPPSPPPKKMSESEMLERQLLIERLEAELRTEEMRLVLLKKIRQSQLLASQQQQQQQQAASESKTIQANGKHPAPVQSSTPPPQPLKSSTKSQQQAVAAPAAGKSSQSQLSSHRQSAIGGGMSASPAHRNSYSQNIQQQQQQHNHNRIASGLLSRAGSSTMGLGGSPSPASPGIMHDKRDQLRNSTSSPSVMSPSVTLQSSRQTEDSQSRQAAAKLALRKQLEKTLLQIPPPKPPPPEMHFVPNPNNTEFIYLLGLEAVVDRLTHGVEQPVPPVPFVCSQCGTDFSSLWKWDKAATLEKPAVMCDTCVNNNVKKALKAEHTNRLKTAFVRALQQEQEIEQKIAQGGTISPPLSMHTSSSSQSSNVHSKVYESLPSSTTITPFPKNLGTNVSALLNHPSISLSVTSKESSREQREREREIREHRERERERERSERNEREKERAAAAAAAAAAASAGFDFSKLADPTKLFGHQMSAAATAAALQAQLLRGMGLPSGSASMSSHAQNPLLHHFPLMYNPFQLAMAASAAQAVAQGRGGNASGSANSARDNSAAAFTAASLAELQRQYLLDMLPPGLMANMANMAASSAPSGSRSSQSQSHESRGANWKS